VPRNLLPLKPAAERARALTAAPAPRQAERPSTVERDTETMAMSTLSFQDYVRERMLKRRKEALEGRPAPQPAAQAPMQAAGQGSAGVFAQAAASMPPVAPRRSLAERAALGDLPAQQRLAPAPRPEMHAPIVTREMEHDVGRNTPARDLPRAASHDDWAAAMVMPRADLNLAPTAPAANISGELSALKDMIEDRFNMLAWLGTSRNNPLQSNLMLKLIRAGYSPALVRSVLERLPADSGPADAVRWVMDVLSRNLKATESMTGICDEGGVVALIGATGVGKTTTAAKLAAQCVKQYGANSVGLITLDTYRVAGLRATARLRPHDGRRGPPGPRPCSPQRPAHTVVRQAPGGDRHRRSGPERPPHPGHAGGAGNAHHQKDAGAQRQQPRRHAWTMC
jgi:flagellar biosynthesis protein FlhF